MQEKLFQEFCIFSYVNIVNNEKGRRNEGRVRKIAFLGFFRQYWRVLQLQIPQRIFHQTFFFTFFAKLWSAKDAERMPFIIVWKSFEPSPPESSSRLLFSAIFGAFISGKSIFSTHFQSSQTFDQLNIFAHAKI